MPRFTEIPQKDRIIVALDCDREEALRLADLLAGHAVWMKVGMTLYYQEGPSIVKELKDRGFKVFLDLKFHDIPHQVKGAAKAAVKTGADMITMHSIGTIEMMRAGQEGVAEAAAEMGCEPAATLGVTVLTSMGQGELDEIGVARYVEQQVLIMAAHVKVSGLSGVVASPQEASELRKVLGPDAYIVTPGVRPATAEVGDQKRVATPKAAFEAGASHLVIGRPITQAPDPLQAFDDIVASL